MKALKKSFLTALIFCLSLSMFTGCSDTNQNVDQSPSADPPNTSSAEVTPTASDEPEVPDDKEINAAKEKVKLTMLLCDSGLTIPNGVDINDNAWADAIKEWANVDLTIEQPLYTDYDTKLQLRLSAGDLPDIVHCIGTSYSTTAPEAARDGAFIPLDDYYENSRNVKKVITPEQMAWDTLPDDGKNYFIPMNTSDQPMGNWLIARWDLIEKYNNGKWPETTPEWIAFFEKVKQEIPEAMVLSNWLLKIDYALTYGGRVVYQLYGLPGTGGGGEVWDWKNQKFENEFLTPEYKEATKVMRDLYEKGILDPEFATTEKWYDNKKTKNIVATADAANQVILTRTKYDDYPEGNNQIWRMAAPLKEFPEVVRYPEVAYGTTTNGLTSHGMYISSACKNPDRAFDVLEVMASEEFRDLCVWGTEGYTYEEKDGERVPIMEIAQLSSSDPKSFYWQRQFLTIWVSQVTVFTMKQ